MVACRSCLRALQIGLIALATPLTLNAGRAAECGRAIVTGDPDYRPISWLEGNALQGAAEEIVAAALDRIGQPYEIRAVGPWKRVLSLAETGEIDIVAELKHTPEREAYLAFTSTPVFVNPIAAFTRRQDLRRIVAKEDLVGLRGGTVLGMRFGGDLDAFAAAHLDLKEVPREELGFRMLEAGRLDYFLTSYFPGVSSLMASHQEADFTVQQPYLVETPNYVGIAKHGHCLDRLEAMDGALAALEREGMLKRILDRTVDRWLAGRVPFGLQASKPKG
jgi:polar amino acid transport system substrate-binding protein